MNRVLIIAGAATLGLAIVWLIRSISDDPSIEKPVTLNFQTRKKGKSELIPFDVDVKLNNFYLKDSFELDVFVEKVGKPDRIVRGGAEIIEEFGVDDYDLFYGNSIVHAGHGRVLHVKIVDANLSLNAINTTHNAMDFYRCFKTRLDYHSDTNLLINKSDESIVVVGTAFENFKSIEYFGAPL